MITYSNPVANSDLESQTGRKIEPSAREGKRGKEISEVSDD